MEMVAAVVEAVLEAGAMVAPTEVAMKVGVLEDMAEMVARINWQGTWRSSNRGDWG